MASKRIWDSTTQEVRLAAIRPQFRDAIQAHLADYNLGPILDDALMCIETTSVHCKGAFLGLGKRKMMVSTAVVTPEWLVLAQTDEPDQPGAAVISTRLAEMTATDFAQTPGGRLFADSGLEISGVFTGRVGMHGNQHLTSLLILGDEPAAHRFREVLAQAWQARRR